MVEPPFPSPLLTCVILSVFKVLPWAVFSVCTSMSVTSPLAVVTRTVTVLGASSWAIVTLALSSTAVVTITLAIGLNAIMLVSFGLF